MYLEPPASSSLGVALKSTVLDETPAMLCQYLGERAWEISFPGNALAYVVISKPLLHNTYQALLYVHLQANMTNPLQVSFSVLFYAVAVFLVNLLLKNQ